MEWKVSTLDGDDAGTIELPASIFALEPRPDLLQRMIRYQLAKRQSGTHKAKTRSEIQRTGAKLGKQKGGGRARHGSRRAPIFVGGSKAHGPRPRSHAIGLPKKVRALALRHALSVKAQAGELLVIDKVEAGEVRTSELSRRLRKLGVDSALIVAGAAVDDQFFLSARNIPQLDVLPNVGINVYDILRRDKLILTKEAVAALEARLG